ncbi:tRNA lysidine(34) synthetase TilS [Dokdonella sp.]|uniref:tRNA lysidine(34) synthetase TilS n=1 Tax=Dokdonella sp. TaxID=2291710 RepID=UPI0025BA3C56|nr:tRNA lysidine(34) synthetase TilS [Dokdonella sp.]MBX3693506.1 tRNA lysidine(34) synthetase TilS [Dokdonella sp.]
MNRRLRDVLEPALAALPDGPLAVAFSGGLDSSVLLHGLAALPAARARGLRAIHVDHGLYVDSDEWTQRCARIAADLSIDFASVRVDVPRGSGLGLEAAARRMRHTALQDELRAEEIVAFAHHRDDQAETVLLKLLRGAGPEGLAAMRPLRRFGQGLAWRPLLSLSRAALHSYAEHHQLNWVHDPSNADPVFDRNYLRLDVMPRLRRRWPEADASIAQSATWVRAAADFIEAEAARALAQIQGLDPHTLRYREWLALPDALRDPVLRRWLRELGLPEPTQHQVGELMRQLGEAGEDKLPCVRWPGSELRRYRDLVHARRPIEMVPATWDKSWDGRPLELPAALGQLQLVDAAGAALATPLHETLRVRFRRGGESLRLNVGSHHRDLRDLFQEAGIPPWERGRLPLILDSHGTLLAVADFWLGSEGRALFEALELGVRWCPHVDRAEPGS